LLIFSESKTADEWVVSKSKFIGHTLMGDSRESFLKDVLEISRKHKTANHVAFAYQIRSNNSTDAYFYDAGEPSGTAGKPLLKILESKKIVNSGIAVVRYYGGVNLGTGGLARAYTKAGMMALTGTKIENFIPLYLYNLTIKYNVLDKISNLIYESGGLILDRNFDTNIHLISKLTKEVAENINDNFPTVKISSLSNN
jgi:uncharacterized YigZ family protein|tara:strand:- start:100 stop:693 length:594 start_codon:yes stop_codon:yes gene_type:complete